MSAFLAEDETAANVIFRRDPDPGVAPPRFDADGEISRGHAVERHLVRPVAPFDRRDGSGVAPVGRGSGFEVVVHSVAPRWAGGVGRPLFSVHVTPISQGADHSPMGAVLLRLAGQVRATDCVPVSGPPASVATIPRIHGARTWVKEGREVSYTWIWMCQPSGASCQSRPLSSLGPRLSEGVRHNARRAFFADRRGGRPTRVT